MDGTAVLRKTEAEAEAEEEGEEEEAALLRTLASDHENPEEDENGNRGKREVCWEGCGRPRSVCLCPYLPPSPLPTSTTLVVLHHPHEQRHPLATLPLLSRCLLRCHSLPGRRLRPGLSPLLDAACDNRSHTAQALFLFPSPDPSAGLAEWAARNPPDSRRDTLLIAFDGTWRHAREMVAASMPFLGQFARQVSLGWDAAAEGDSTFESELVLRKEPFLGCVSTLEAVARSLRLLEAEETGAEVERTLLDVLRAMVRFQASHLKPMMPRPRRRKKKEMMKKKTEEE